MSDQHIINKLVAIENQIAILKKEINNIQQMVSGKASRSNLLVTEKDINGKIRDLSDIVNKLDQKLTKIKLPEDTKFYLETVEIETFRSNMKQLLAMMASFEKLYQNLVAYSIKK